MGNAELIKDALAAIADAREKGFNVLTADIALSGLSEWHVPVVEVVTLDPNPANGDIYEQQQKYAVTRQGLSKLAVAAGVIWSASETKRTDDRRCRDYVSFQGVGGIQKPDGTYTFMKAEYDLDMEVVEEELREGYTQKAKGDTEKMAWIKNKSDQFKKDWIDDNVKRDMLQKRKNKMKLCESGAKDRVIRELLGIKATYPLEQIKKPFVILRITVRPDYTDKDVKRAMLTAAIQSMTGIYGGGSIPAQIPYEEPIDVTDISREEEPGPPAPESTADDPFSLKQESPVDDETDFKNSSPEEQIQTVREMIKRKGQREENLNRPLEKQSRTEILGLFNWLKNQPDKVAA